MLKNITLRPICLKQEKDLDPRYQTLDPRSVVSQHTFWYSKKRAIILHHKMHMLGNTTLHYTTPHHTTPHYTTPHNTTLHHPTLHYTAYLCNDPRVTGPSEIAPGSEVLLSPVASVSGKEGRKGREGKGREKEAERTRRRGRKGVEGRGGLKGKGQE